MSCATERLGSQHRECPIKIYESQVQNATKGLNAMSEPEKMSVIKSFLHENHKLNPWEVPKIQKDKTESLLSDLEEQGVNKYAIEPVRKILDSNRSWGRGFLDYLQVWAVFMQIACYNCMFLGRSDCRL